MKKKILSFIFVNLILFVNQSLFAIDTVKQIDVIKSLYTQYNKEIKKYEKKEFDIIGESTEGGEIIVYYNAKDIRKITVIFYGETGKSITEFYVFNGTPFFVLKSTINYNKLIYEKKNIIQDKKEERLYFYDKGMIKWIDDSGKSIDHNTLEFKRKEKDVLFDYNRFSKYYFSK